MALSKEEVGDSGFPADLSRPALRVLQGAGYTRLEELAKVTEGELGKLHGMGPNGVRALKRALAERGLAFKEEK